MRSRFRLLAVIQVIFLVLSIALLVWTFRETEHIAVPAVLLLLVLLQVYAIVRSVEKHVDTLEDFFSAINYEDFTQRFISDDVDAELKTAFNRILERFQDARAQREVQANYLEVVFRHVPVPLLAARSDGSLRMVNNPARRLTGLGSLRHLDDLAQLDPALPQMIREIEPGQQRMLQTHIRDIPVELRVAVSEIRMAGNSERLYSIENLSGELTAREASAWRNLIRVLTHEIMNTLTPISSLAQSSADMLNKPDSADDIREAVETIARRSDGLMSFVSRYRELLKVPQPVLADIRVADVLNSVVAFLADNLRNTAIAIEVIPRSLELRADSQLLDQLLVNVVKNAADAMQESVTKSLRLSAGIEYGRVIIRIIDSGPGIPENLQDQVFIPFFTTKRDGSGIGLSLSRQIMTAHGGEIAVRRLNDETVVSLVF